MGQQLHSNITIPASATTLIEKKGDNYIYRRPDYYCMSTVKKKTEPYCPFKTHVTQRPNELARIVILFPRAENLVSFRPG